MAVTASDAPMLALFVLSWYMPPVLFLYVRHARHVCIKYRLPRRTAVPMLLFMVYSILNPTICVFGKEWPSLGKYIINFFLLPVALVFFIITEAMIVVLFQITELLMLPQSSTPHKVRRLILYRWLLHPPIQITLATVVLLALVTPFFNADVSTLLLPSAVGAASKLFVENTTVLMGEVVVLLFVVLLLSWYISHIVDNFGLRRSYQQTFRSISLVIILVGLMRISLLTLNASEIAPLNLPSFFATIGAHMFFYFHVCLPVRAMQTSGYVTPRTRARSTSRIHPNNLDEKKSILEKFLSAEPRFKSFLTFARMEYSTEPLLALRAIEAFDSGEPSLAAATRLVQQCLVPHCEMETDVGRKLHGLYHDKLVEIRLANAARVPPGFFRPFRQDLLAWIVKELVPEFMEHPLGVEYALFARMEKSMDRLNVVLACVEDVDTI
ncbi:hypothetical protein ACHHYP_14103 [Achlya hypogyna]|uniref:RGS domain-containing protein n=1 Tax=Achlya hypogyna TaxID=1202772 RepID=A0A1V9YE05_ACHHY|nr:hypothetical protein ACHHYP_14103 [Achlya hypogyna]